MSGILSSLSLSDDSSADWMEIEWVSEEAPIRLEIVKAWSAVSDDDGRVFYCSAVL